MKDAVEQAQGRVKDEWVCEKVYGAQRQRNERGE